MSLFDSVKPEDLAKLNQIGDELSEGVENKKQIAPKPPFIKKKGYFNKIQKLNYLNETHNLDTVEGSDEYFRIKDWHSLQEKTAQEAILQGLQDNPDLKEILRKQKERLDITQEALDEAMNEKIPHKIVDREAWVDKTESLLGKSNNQTILYKALSDVIDPEISSQSNKQLLGEIFGKTPQERFSMAEADEAFENMFKTPEVKLSMDDADEAFEQLFKSDMAESSMSQADEAFENMFKTPEVKLSMDDADEAFESMFNQSTSTKDVSSTFPR